MTATTLLPATRGSLQARGRALTIATRLLWLAAAFAVIGTVLAAVIPIRTPHAIGGVGFLSYVLPGLLLTALLTVGAHLAGRGRDWVISVSLLGTVTGLVILIFVVLTLAYVCFDMSPTAAATAGCTGPLGTKNFAAASGLCVAACPALTFFALVSGVVAAVRG